MSSKRKIERRRKGENQMLLSKIASLDNENYDMVRRLEAEKSRARDIERRIKLFSVAVEFSPEIVAAGYLEGLKSNEKEIAIAKIARAFFESGLIHEAETSSPNTMSHRITYTFMALIPAPAPIRNAPLDFPFPTFYQSQPT